jgi:transposase
MWTPMTRQQHSREHLRYGSDLTDAEWAIIAPLLPAPRSTGRPRRWPMRELTNAIFYVLCSGCPRRIVPANFAPPSTVYRSFLRLRDDSVFDAINHQLLVLDRERVRPQASPSAAVLDGQSVKTTEAGGPRGCDAGKKVKGRKRHALVDTDGRALVLHTHRASFQDRDGSVLRLKSSRGSAAIRDSSRTSKQALLRPEAFLYAASVMLLASRLGRSS